MTGSRKRQKIKGDRRLSSAVSFLRNRVLCVSLAVLLLNGLMACSRQAQQQVRAAAVAKPISVTAAAAQVQAKKRVFEVTGTLLPFEQVTVSSEVDGPVAKIYVDLGDRVTQGQPLAEVDRAEFQIQVNQAQATLQQAMARLGLKPGEDHNRIREEQTAEVLKAKAALDEAALTHRRARNLFELQIGTKQAVDTTEAALKTAEANSQAALDTVRTVKAQIEQYKAAVELARKKLNDTTVRAPFAGSVQERYIALGQFLKQQAPAFLIVQTNPLRLRADVAERFARGVRENQQVKVSVDGLTETFTARVSRVSPAVSQQSRTLLIEALVDNGRQLLRPGGFARASVISDESENVLLAPASAVVNYYGVNKVYVIDGGKVQERTVKLGDRFGDEYEITEGLRPNERVAMSNLEKLSTGTVVQIN